MKKENDLLCIYSEDESELVITKLLYKSYSNQIHEKIQQMMNFYNKKDYSKDKICLSANIYEWKNLLSDKDLLRNDNFLYFIFDDYRGIDFYKIFCTEISTAIKIFRDAKCNSFNVRNANDVIKLLSEIQTQVIPNILTIIEKNFFIDEKTWQIFIFDFDSIPINESSKEYSFKGTKSIKTFNLKLETFLNPPLLLQNLHNIIENTPISSETCEIQICFDFNLDKLVLKYIFDVIKSQKDFKLAELNNLLTCELEFIKNKIVVETKSIYQVKKPSEFVRMLKFILKKFQELRNYINKISKSSSIHNFDTDESKKLIIQQLEKIWNHISHINLHGNIDKKGFKVIKKIFTSENKKIDKLIGEKLNAGKNKDSKNYIDLSYFMHKKNTKTMKNFLKSKQIKKSLPTMKCKNNEKKQNVKTDISDKKLHDKIKLDNFLREIMLNIHFVNIDSYQINRKMIASLSYLSEINMIDLERFINITEEIKSEFPIYFSRIINNLEMKNISYKTNPITYKNLDIKYFTGTCVEKFISTKNFLSYPEEDDMSLKEEVKGEKCDSKKISFDNRLPFVSSSSEYLKKKEAKKKKLSRFFNCFSSQSEYYEDLMEITDSTEALRI